MKQKLIEINMYKFNIFNPVYKINVIVFVHPSCITGMKPEVSKISNAFFIHLVIIVKHDIWSSGADNNFSHLTSRKFFVGLGVCNFNFIPRGFFSARAYSKRLSWSHPCALANLSKAITFHKFNIKSFHKFLYNVMRCR